MILSRFKHHFLSPFISTVSSLIIGSSFTIVHRSFLWLPLYSFPLYFQFHNISLFHFSSIACPYDLSFDHSSSLQYFPPHIFFLSFYSIITLNSSPSSLLITCPYHLSLASSPSLQCLPPYVFLSFYSIITLNSSPSSLLITCPYHLSLASSPSLQCLPPYVFLSFYSIITLNSSPSSLLITCPYHLSLASSPSLQCLPPYVFLSFHSIITLNSSPSSLLITCPYHLSLAFLVIFPMFTTLRLPIFPSHNNSEQFFFISSYYVSISFQPCFPHFLYNVYYPSYYVSIPS